MAMRGFYDNPTAGDAIIEPLELSDLVPDVRFDGLGSVHVAERDLQRDLHTEIVPSASELSSAICPAVQLPYPARRPEMSE
jgi:hypothetical protein